jgi:hypothetical protein
MGMSLPQTEQNPLTFDDEDFGMALKSRMNRSERTQCFEYEDPYKIVLISRNGNGCKLSAETITNEDTEIRIKLF